MPIDSTIVDGTAISFTGDEHIDESSQMSVIEWVEQINRDD